MKQCIVIRLLRCSAVDIAGQFNSKKYSDSVNAEEYDENRSEGINYGENYVIFGVI